MLLSFFLQKKKLCHCVPLQILLLLCFIIINNENKARNLFNLSSFEGTIKTLKINTDETRRTKQKFMANG